MSLRRDLAKAVEAVLNEAGVVGWSVRQVRSGHKKYQFTWNNNPIMFTTASTPSDTRATIYRATSGLRRILGVKREVHKNPANRAKRAPRTQKAILPKCPRLTPGNDPWAQLQGLSVTPHFGPLGTGSIGLDAAAYGMADGIVGVMRW